MAKNKNKIGETIIAIIVVLCTVLIVLDIYSNIMAELLAK
jgi:hypothetical protein